MPDNDVYCAECCAHITANDLPWSHDGPNGERWHPEYCPTCLLGDGAA